MAPAPLPVHRPLRPLGEEPSHLEPVDLAMDSENWPERAVSSSNLESVISADAVYDLGDEMGRRVSVATLGSGCSSWGSELGSLSHLRPRQEVPEFEGAIGQYYQARSFLASGASRAVRTARCKADGEVRAVKTIQLSKSADAMLVRGEVKLAGRLRHPHLARLHAVYWEPEQVHLVMEHCKGGNLLQKISSCSTLTMKGLPTKVAAAYMWQMLEGIAYLHHYSVAHRDIKPSHYVLQNDDCDTVKLVDFGSACVFTKGVPMKIRCGTPFFFAPEILEACYTEKCDVWGVGVVGYMLVAGRSPFSANSGEDFERHLRSKAPIDFNAKEWLTRADARKVVQELLAWDPKVRPAAKQAMRGSSWLRKHGRPHGPCCCTM
mmetsp:Transcript_384/g.1000  ORF Transcript_384/g.1000 Transcript_384/m.1000 type:complete len:377 (-) Transcript_384:33-1163(-)